MVKFLKTGKVVIILQGKYAGKKAVIAKTYDEGMGDRHYGHCIVAGVARAPLKVTKGMSEKKVAKRSRVKPFVRRLNYTHVMPTRYSVEFDKLKAMDLGADAVSSEAKKKEKTKEVKKIFEERYTSGRNRWFFT